MPRTSLGKPWDDSDNAGPLYLVRRYCDGSSAHDARATSSFIDCGRDLGACASHVVQVRVDELRPVELAIAVMKPVQCDEDAERRGWAIHYMTESKPARSVFPMPRIHPRAVLLVSSKEGDTSSFPEIGSASLIIDSLLVEENALPRLSSPSLLEAVRTAHARALRNAR